MILKCIQWNDFKRNRVVRWCAHNYSFKKKSTYGIINIIKCVKNGKSSKIFTKSPKEIVKRNRKRYHPRDGSKLRIILCKRQNLRIFYFKSQEEITKNSNWTKSCPLYVCYHISVGSFSLHWKLPETLHSESKHVLTFECTYTV